MKTGLIDLNSSFPELPVPEIRIWVEPGFAATGDIPLTLKTNLSQLPWSQVDLARWRSLGVSPSVAVRYLEPTVFLYYLPSLLRSALGSLEGARNLLEAIVPANGARQPKGEWWLKVLHHISAHQKIAINQVLDAISKYFSAQMDDWGLELLEAARCTWK